MFFTRIPHVWWQVADRLIKWQRCQRHAYQRVNRTTLLSGVVWLALRTVPTGVTQIQLEKTKVVCEFVHSNPLHMQTGCCDSTPVESVRGVYVPSTWPRHGLSPTPWAQEPCVKRLTDELMQQQSANKMIEQSNWCVGRPYELVCACLIE